MDTEDVWVVYNNESNKILHVFALEWQAEKKAEWYWTNPSAPVTGTKHNTGKIEVLNLKLAVEDIETNAYYYNGRR